MEKSQPIRMCISCRSRHPQKMLIRLKQINTKIVVHNGTGRSFYVCRTCIEDEKKLYGLAKRFKQDYQGFQAFLQSLI
jgi:predicted RNA-binding protein YlxR (DUF448 family)